MDLWIRGNWQLAKVSYKYRVSLEAQHNQPSKERKVYLSTRCKMKVVLILLVAVVAPFAASLAVKNCGKSMSTFPKWNIFKM